ncbi:unnamed protein product [Rotaria sp. Silwood2]|nr:unnamed protein product [Rotaria sp. Silwood2]
MESNSTIVQMNHDEKIYYEKVDEYINSLDKMFREKCVIKQQVYDDILKCLLLPKGSRSDAYSSTFVYWAHAAVSHGGGEKTYFELNSQYSWIPRFCVEIFLKQCLPCQTRKPLKQHVISKPIISLGVMARLQIDLIDMRTRPDRSSPDITYSWILNCIDHFSKFSWAFPLRNKSAKEVATKLCDLFLLLDHHEYFIVITAVNSFRILLQN